MLGFRNKQFITSRNGLGTDARDVLQNEYAFFGIRMNTHFISRDKTQFAKAPCFGGYRVRNGTLLVVAERKWRRKAESATPSTCEQR